LAPLLSDVLKKDFLEGSLRRVEDFREGERAEAILKSLDGGGK
jgi:hypothetical protein